MATVVDGMRLPIVVAPMLGVSGPDLVVEACRAGVAGAFPSANCRSPEQLAEWLEEIAERVAVPGPAHPTGPLCVNLIVHRSNPRLEQDLAVVLASAVDVVITSVGSPEMVVRDLHRAGKHVWADVASLRHLDRAGAAGVDGVILLTAGSGGQTGWANPIAFTRAARSRFGGLIALAGRIGDGASVAAAQVLGADLAYCGTRFIATVESLASPEYKASVTTSEMDDVVLTDAVTGLPANLLRQALEAATSHSRWEPGPRAADPGGVRFDVESTLPGANGPVSRWADAWSAGHGVSGVRDIPTVSALVAGLEREYRSSVSTSGAS